MVAVEKLNKKQKLEIYKKLLNVSNPDTLDKAAFAEKIGVSAQVLGGMIGQLKMNPKMRRDLEDSGYAPNQIPNWVAQPPTVPKTDTPVPTGTSRVSVATKIPLVTSQVGNQSGGDSGNQSGGGYNPPPGPMEGTVGVH